jgi:hypothetical protein
VDDALGKSGCAKFGNGTGGYFYDGNYITHERYGSYHRKIWDQGNAGGSSDLQRTVTDTFHESVRRWKRSSVGEE